MRLVALGILALAVVLSAGAAALVEGGALGGLLLFGVDIGSGGLMALEVGTFAVEVGAFTLSHEALSSAAFGRPFNWSAMLMQLVENAILFGGVPRHRRPHGPTVPRRQQHGPARRPGLRRAPRHQPGHVRRRGLDCRARPQRALAHRLAAVPRGHHRRLPRARHRQRRHGQAPHGDPAAPARGAQAPARRAAPRPDGDAASAD